MVDLEELEMTDLGESDGFGFESLNGEGGEYEAAFNVVKPRLAKQRPAVPIAPGTPTRPLGTLVLNAPGRAPFSYVFTPEDALWIARFIVGEAGGRDDADNHAVIWAMFNRYALFTHKH